MIIRKNMEFNGVEFVKSYSDNSVYIERDNALYSEAIDPVVFHREYTETNIPIEQQDEYFI